MGREQAIRPGDRRLTDYFLLRRAASAFVCKQSPAVRRTETHKFSISKMRMKLAPAPGGQAAEAQRSDCKHQLPKVKVQPGQLLMEPIEKARGEC